MTRSIRSILAISVLAIVLAACATTPAAPTSEAPAPSDPAAPSVEPSMAPSEAPVDEEREVAGTITVAEGMTFSGPGATVQEALDLGPDDELPQLVNGVLFRDTDGTIYLASSVSNTSVPTFEGPMLEVLNMDSEGDSWDMANAELLGLEEANGIVFNQDAQILGYLELP
jgi:PBP1b-binding outer membrane lipoprotein LpoB